MGKTYFANSTASLRGFTLVELVVVIVILAILSVYAVSSNLDSAEMTVPSQADRLASDIRLAQSLAFTSGSQVSLSSTSSSYTITCLTTGKPCVVPSNFPVTMKNGIPVSSGTSVTFKSNGEPTAIASFTVGSGGSSKTVDVSAQGNVEVK